MIDLVLFFLGFFGGFSHLANFIVDPHFVPPSALTPLDPLTTLSVAAVALLFLRVVVGFLPLFMGVQPSEQEAKGLVLENKLNDGLFANLLEESLSLWLPIAITYFGGYSDWVFWTLFSLCGGAWVVGHVNGRSGKYLIPYCIVISFFLVPRAFVAMTLGPFAVFPLHVFYNLAVPNHINTSQSLRNLWLICLSKLALLVLGIALGVVGSGDFFLFGATERFSLVISGIVAVGLVCWGMITRGSEVNWKRLFFALIAAIVAFLVCFYVPLTGGTLRLISMFLVIFALFPEEFLGPGSKNYIFSWVWVIFFFLVPWSSAVSRALLGGIFASVGPFVRGTDKDTEQLWIYLVFPVLFFLAGLLPLGA